MSLEFTYILGRTQEEYEHYNLYYSLHYNFQNEPEAEGSSVLVTSAADVTSMSSLECVPPAPSADMNFMTLAEAAAEEATSGMLFVLFVVIVEWYIVCIAYDSSKWYIVRVV